MVRFETAWSFAIFAVGATSDGDGCTDCALAHMDSIKWTGSRSKGVSDLRAEYFFSHFWEYFVACMYRATVECGLNVLCFVVCVCVCFTVLSWLYFLHFLHFLLLNFILCDTYTSCVLYSDKI